ncbi:N-acetylmuramoyl-L-alanine amidase [Streptomyces sp. NPDC048219]|uniref:N-acetylmuramoyl-L-alanine amidase n=1 Tax=Streptomyces sp. NPDC048219 TaxID=3365517 RepID=UPI00371D15E8
MNHPNPPTKHPDRSRLRRALLLGAGATALSAIVYTAVSITGHGDSRHSNTAVGAVDQAGAAWSAASGANYRAADRPHDYAIDRIVVHVTESTQPIAEQVFQDPGHRASAHYLIRADDGHITQMVREHDVAFQAGNREWNNSSIGIEHEGFVNQPDRWFTEAAYKASAELVAGIAERHDVPLDREHIVGHNEVPDATHTDPGPRWDWDRYMALVRSV